MNATVGSVYLVGAGPGDPELITVKGRRLLAAADVVLYDRLIPHGLLAETKPSAELIDVSKAPGRVAKKQEATNTLLVEHARRGRRVVRLKGGDPFIFGRGSEELAACHAADVPCEVVPGISSALAVPAVAGIPVTQRELSRSFAVLTGHTKDTTDVPDYDYAALAKLDTLVILMGRSNLAALAKTLIDAGRSADEPAAVVASGTLPEQQSVVATLSTIADRADAAELAAPAVVVVGKVAALGAAAVRETADVAAAPLRDRRIALTQAITTTSELRRGLLAGRATVVDLPLIQITHPTQTRRLDDALRSIERIDWITFTSVNGVRGFWRRLSALGFDARRLATCKIAAVGPGTARELEQHGIRADLVPTTPAAHGLVAELGEQVAGKTVLYPHGSHALPTLWQGLAAADAEVIADVVYCTEPNEPTADQRQRFDQGVEVIVFASPSAVQQYAALSLSLGNAAVACIGPTTAHVAEELGFPVDIVPAQPGSRGLVHALEDHFRHSSVNERLRSNAPAAVDAARA